MTDAIKQELTDMKESLSRTLTRIEEKIDKVDEQVRTTNGRVTTLEVKQEDCPARKFHEDGTTKRDHIILVASAVSSGLTGIIVFIITRILGG